MNLIVSVPEFIYLFLVFTTGQKYNNTILYFLTGGLYIKAFLFMSRIEITVFDRSTAL